MDRARLDAILSGQRTLADGGKAEKAPIVADREVIACTSALSTLCEKRTGARPLQLQSSQLPPIF
jgi:hypothetical protein